MKNLLLGFTFLTFLSFETKAQDDPNVGFYADGVKVDKIDCYDFQDLKVVFLYNQEWSQYDYIKISVQVGGAGQIKKGLGTTVEKAIPMSSIGNYKKGNYIIYTIYGVDKSPIDLCAKPNQGDLLPTMQARFPTKGDLKYDGALKKGNPSDDAILNVYLTGLTFKGVTEEFNPSCNCFEKTKRYSFTDLKKEINLVLTGRFTGGNKERYIETDLTKPCVYSGTKVDFNILGKSLSSSNNSSISNTTPTNNTTLKVENHEKTSATTSKTVITSVVPTSVAAVKPLDKTKPGYFEEKSEDKKYMYRNGYQKSEGVYHGEVREYENNQLEKIIIYTDGVEEGLYVSFSDSKVECQGAYKNGKKDGVWKYFKDGKLEETENYVSGIRQD